LPYISSDQSIGRARPADVPEIISDLYRLYVILGNSTKPIITGAFTKEGLLDMMRMLEAVVGGPEELRRSPRAIFDCCPSSPLMWSDVTCQNLIDCAEHGIPAEIIPAPQMGATSPVSIAGTLVEANAEFLSGVVNLPARGARRARHLRGLPVSIRHEASHCEAGGGGSGDGRVRLG